MVSGPAGYSRCAAAPLRLQQRGEQLSLDVGGGPFLGDRTGVPAADAAAVGVGGPASSPFAVPDAYPSQRLGVHEPVHR